MSSNLRYNHSGAVAATTYARTMQVRHAIVATIPTGEFILIVNKKRIGLPTRDIGQIEAAIDRLSPLLKK